MDPTQRSLVISRISAMERCYDRLLQVAATDPDAIVREPEVRSQLEQLRQYYEGGLWLRDYELDEQGCLPAQLKRGVLSQDGVFDLLTTLQQLPESQ